jgi:hypothetical protein
MSSMRRIVFTLSCMALPLGAMALSFADQSLMYTDAPFSPSESAGISLLTNIGAVQGNPDGTYRSSRTLNRAEFLKISLLSHPRIIVSKSDATRCFPDVSEKDWFSEYVCLAKKRDIISGYPDGFFRPGNPVNYAEALKILGELYDYTAYADPDAPWYEFYAQAAQNHKTILPISLSYDRYITRGQMARLAAAYRAEYEGLLPEYRNAELGKRAVVQKPVVEPEEEPEEEVPQEPETPPEENIPTIPVRSSFLMVGESGLIADAKLYVRDNSVELRQVKVTLEREARSAEELSIEDGSGTHLGTLKLDLNDRDNETWKITYDVGESGYTLPAGQATNLVVRALIKERGKGGFSEEWVEVKSLFIIVSEIGDPTVSYQIVPSGAHYPVHQTSQARITDVTNTLGTEDELRQGSERQVASFFIEREVHPEVSFRVRHLRFHAHHSRGVQASNWELRSLEDSRRYSCSTEGTDSLELTTINCLAIPEELGSVEVLQLFADIDFSQASPGDTLQVNLEIPGSLSESGDIRWTDGSADFQWTTLPAPIAEGTLWEY